MRVKLLVTIKPNSLKYIILNYESLGEHIIPDQEVKNILDFSELYIKLSSWIVDKTWNNIERFTLPISTCICKVCSSVNIYLVSAGVKQ